MCIAHGLTYYKNEDLAMLFSVTEKGDHVEVETWPRGVSKYSCDGEDVYNTWSGIR